MSLLTCILIHFTNCTNHLTLLWQATQVPAKTKTVNQRRVLWGRCSGNQNGARKPQEVLLKSWLCTVEGYAQVEWLQAVSIHLTIVMSSSSSWSFIHSYFHLCLHFPLLITVTKNTNRIREVFFLPSHYVLFLYLGCVYKHLPRYTNCQT